jgi:hypothetical protein
LGMQTRGDGTDVRSATSALTQWNKVRSDCTIFHATLARVQRLELRRSPADDDIIRVATAVYNEGGSALGHAYDTLRNQDYRIGKPFPYPKCLPLIGSKHKLSRSRVDRRL